MANRYPSLQYRMGSETTAHGPGTISGTVAIDGSPAVPAQRQVRLHDRYTGRVLRSTLSDPVTGAYSFQYLEMGREFFVVAHDHLGVHNAVIKDAIVPE